ncbi:glycosyltransferase [Algoriphagus aquimarinus]|uniref:Glycosyltransferase involved in cell wall bisynthesis n=1 Tax=Algoriphagus aquimarinus TaxID=237018 RepID=A0A1I1AYY5_9BACT|nr:glycosyltransferase [Algoriphagus aquimarinus]SFB41648.1 Glycosyltransferase involved in cell wall bisynthesis [Algoriphagus aquimarinus]
MKKYHKRNLLIIGKTPPPIGGVTIHVKRLLDSLKDDNTIQFTYFDLKRKSKIKLFILIWKSKVVHLHTSNSYFRFFVVLYCRLLLKKIIFTFHGNLGRYNLFRNLIDKLSILFSNYPIVINFDSFNISYKINSETKLISAFIPQSSIVPLEDNLNTYLNVKSTEYQYIFCTNAFDVSYDKFGNEVYQILELVNVFAESELNNQYLIISDPSGNYNKFLIKKGIKVPENILFINFPHDFNAVLKKSDCFIRYTTTDGDSLSVKEALMLNKNVIASDVVQRPYGVQLTKLDSNDLIKHLINFKPYISSCSIDNGFVQLLELYKNINLK